MIIRLSWVITLTGILILSLGQGLSAQHTEEGYEVRFAPDAWYNDVDGIRIGVRLRGQVPGTFNDGPHRLDAGLWLGTWFPELPVSYYVKYTEPIPAISDFNSEGSISAITSIREGLHWHALGFDKRWQPGFYEDTYTEFHFWTGFHKRFEDEYVPFPALWQPEGVAFLHTGVEGRYLQPSGMFYYRADIRSGAQADEFGNNFMRFDADLRQVFNLSRGLNVRLRGTFGATSGDLPPEYQTTASFASAIDWVWSGFFRSKGTIPMPFLESGVMQLTGGPSVRGYNKRDIKAAKNGTPIFYDQYAGVNFELDYPNPVDKGFEKIPIVGDFLRLRSYLFSDAMHGSLTFGDSETIANAGAGVALSLNIPDQLGKPRGFVIRYDVPFWLSDPMPDENEFRFRSLVSFGAVIGL